MIREISERLKGPKNFFFRSVDFQVKLSRSRFHFRMPKVLRKSYKSGIRTGDFVRSSHYARDESWVPGEDRGGWVAEWSKALKLRMKIN